MTALELVPNIYNEPDPYLHLTDARLLDLAHQGAILAFSELHGRHVGIVHRVAKRILGDQLAVDLQPTIFEQAWNNIGRCQNQVDQAVKPGQTSYPAWINILTHRRAISEKRRLRTREAVELPSGMRNEIALGNAAEYRRTPEDLVVDADHSELTDALAMIKPIYRYALIAIYIERIPAPVYAKENGIGEKTARSRASKGLSHLLDMAGVVGGKKSPGAQNKMAALIAARGTY